MLEDAARASAELKANTPFIVEFAQLLDRYGLSETVGLSLLHDHPQIRSGQIAVETYHSDTELMITGRRSNDVPDGFFETIWRVRGGLLECVQGCGGCKV